MFRPLRRKSSTSEQRPQSDGEQQQRKAEKRSRPRSTNETSACDGSNDNNNIVIEAVAIHNDSANDNNHPKRRTFQSQLSMSTNNIHAGLNENENHDDTLPASAAEASIVLESSRPLTATSVSVMTNPKMDMKAGEKGPRKAMEKEAVKKDEHRWKKITTRSTSGLFMFSAFLLILHQGHVYICGLVALIEILLFRELVKVRYHVYFDIIEDKIPLFRTTQWMWFVVSIFYTYSDFVIDVIKSNTNLHYLLPYAHFQAPIALMLYSATFVLTITTIQPGHIKFQVNQLCWTIVVLCLTVGQLKYIMHNIYNGLIWFTLPILLVATNDVFAYICGVSLGRKFIRRPFLTISPNKTWEGFIGAAISTIIVAWYLSRYLAQFTWMTCPTNKFELFPSHLSCDLHPVFHQADSSVPPQVFELLPAAIVKMIPGIVDICSVHDSPTDLTACISGESTHTHHHFAFILKGVYPIQMHALSLGMFASLVAPFGGFLASAIKRAYGIKDFDSIIPGHGGVMDRMDCQFLMALCTWVHYNTFVKLNTVSVPKMIYMYHLLSESEQVEFLNRITEDVDDDPAIME